jgi:hypothetical protein
VYIIYRCNLRSLVHYDIHRTSGITKEALRKVTTTLSNVDAVLRQLISSRTILVGHSLNSDLKVLHLVKDMQDGAGECSRYVAR